MHISLYAFSPTANAPTKKASPQKVPLITVFQGSDRHRGCDLQKSSYFMLYSLSIADLGSKPSILRLSYCGLARFDRYRDIQYIRSNYQTAFLNEIPTLSSFFQRFRNFFGCPSSRYKTRNGGKWKNPLVAYFQNGEYRLLTTTTTQRKSIAGHVATVVRKSLLSKTSSKFLAVFYFKSIKLKQLSNFICMRIAQNTSSN